MRPNRFAPLLCLAVLLLAAAGPRAAVPDDPDAVLDALHARAAAADFEGYFALFTDDAVFLGTDAAERWPIAEFRAYTRARFATGTGWTYVPAERHLRRGPSGDVIWFDELVIGERMGPCRGTGVLVRTDAGWRIAHYSLTVLVPNEIVEEVVGLGAALEAAAGDRAPD
jgi:ketosteroid isomerase-like protein